ncbi:glyoxalase [Nocardiopsis changdeensis]|uniref:Glyoxalase n=1 Tax=Nocardiopsis changdeensis TaxID=2831969 RepID=A0ABX8BKC0_9ACTN|nr:MULTISPECIES: glyoxalase [Nocardiopsis]QUX22684.1 glyoxalase [Nocardiopsis changdeensis]QYX38627.1 glyoxalase [Nocardiopsis sp. MT53]
MTNIASITLDAADTEAADRFYATAFDLGGLVRTRTAAEPASGFRGFTLSLITSQPADVDVLFESALAAGATVLKPAAKSMWGYGGIVQAPDGAIWQLATSAKKNTGPATGKVDEVVLLLGVEDVAATKKFYAGRGLTVSKSFGRSYAEFATDPGSVKLSLYRCRALAKTIGVDPQGSGPHGLLIGGDIGSCADPDGFAWQAPATADAS